jgi:hypothetical protein
MRKFLASLLVAIAMFVGVAVIPATTPTASAQIAVEIGVPPVCDYGYYDYYPYACAPYGFYGPGYFYNGIFLGVGPWWGWGYGHGWGGHRFYGAGGGYYRDNGRGGHWNGDGRGAVRGGAVRGGGYHSGGGFHGGGHGGGHR